MSLPAAADWRAFLVHDADCGVWYAHAGPFVEALGSHEIVAADDKGRVLLLTVYSGKWTAHTVAPDGQWLAPSPPADVDARVEGREFYAAGKGGSVHQITLLEQPFAKFLPQSREIGHRGGEEFHAILAADVDPTAPGDELLVFGITGAAYQLRAQGDGDEGSGAFAMRRLAVLPGRVRDTVVLPPAAPDGAPLVVAASRSGHLLGLRLRGEDLQVQVLAAETSGLGRVARRPRQAGAPEVVYATRDDGVLLRFEQQQGGGFAREVIFAGAQGLRGVAAGRFFADGREAVAVYGYGREVQLVSRADAGAADRAGGWAVTTLFTSAQQGHWLCVGEFDGRNTTDELVATGFDGEVVLLARPIGYGFEGVAVPR
ncbi:MAG: hypothetical protein AB7O84_09555 [Planctomycetota bacterium]